MGQSLCVGCVYGGYSLHVLVVFVVDRVSMCWLCL